ncbi:hypothetical protein ILYODFUR_010805 [Ilyodon furcidens]|uniref:Uncharacterized protein n=1 Tax=Ilyodon furcidens TaxID=33524 RepID=A0ABV0U5M9_9TELE
MLKRCLHCFRSMINRAQFIADAIRGIAGHYMMPGSCYVALEPIRNDSSSGNFITRRSVDKRRQIGGKGNSAAEEEILFLTEKHIFRLFAQFYCQNTALCSLKFPD